MTGVTLGVAEYYSMVVKATFGPHLATPLHLVEDQIARIILRCLVHKLKQ